MKQPYHSHFEDVVVNDVQKAAKLDYKNKIVQQAFFTLCSLCRWRRWIGRKFHRRCASAHWQVENPPARPGDPNDDERPAVESDEQEAL